MHPAKNDDISTTSPPSPQVIDWGGALVEHERWLRTVVRCRVEDAHATEDVLQEIAVSVLKQNARPTDPASVAPWLYRVAVRQAISHRRRRDRGRKLIEAAKQNGQERTTGDPRDWVFREELREAVNSALALLNPQDRQILVLKYTEKWGYRQLAEHLGVGMNVIEYRLLRAKKRLRSQLQGAGGRETGA